MRRLRTQKKQLSATLRRCSPWALVTVDLSKLSGKAKRINITLPEHLLYQIDEYASSHGESRSGMIAHAALEYIATGAER